MDRLPILPLGQVVVYPHVVLPMALSDPHAVQLIDEVVQGNKRLLLGIVKPLAGAEPPEGAVMQARPDELYEVGTLGSVVRDRKSTRLNSSHLVISYAVFCLEKKMNITFSYVVYPEAIRASASALAR